MEADAFLTGHCMFYYYVTDIDLISQFTYLFGDQGAFIEALGLLVEDLKADHGSLEAKVRSDDPYIVAHYHLNLLDALGDKHHLFKVCCALVVPFRYLFLESQFLHSFTCIHCGPVRIYSCFNKRIGGKPVCTMKSC